MSKVIKLVIGKVRAKIQGPWPQHKDLTGVRYDQLKKGLTMTQTRLNPSHKYIAQRNSIQNQKEKQILTWT